MEIRRRRGGRIAVFSFAGQGFEHLRLKRVTKEVRAQIEDGAVHLVFDVDGIAVITSMALGYMLFTQKRAVANGGELVLVATSTPLQRTLAIFGLEDTLRLFPDEEAAVRHLDDRDSGNAAGAG